MNYKFNINDIVTVKETGEQYVIKGRWMINGSARYECSTPSNEFLFENPDIKIFKEDDLERTLFDAKFNIGEECAKENPVQSGGPISALLLGDIVITRDGEKYVYFPYMPHWDEWTIEPIPKGVLVDKNNTWLNVNDYDLKTLTMPQYRDNFDDIMEIWRPQSFLNIKNFDYKGDIRDTGKLIWIRQEQERPNTFEYMFNADSRKIFSTIFGAGWIDEVGRRLFGRDKYKNALVGGVDIVNGNVKITFYVRY